MAKKNIGEMTENSAETKENAVETTEMSFSKQAFMLSKTYKPHRDLLGVLLEDGKVYTKPEVNKMIDGYLKRSVK